MLNLTEVERRILINQARILAALYPLEAAEFERTARILTEGYHEGWEEVVLRGLKLPYLKEEMNFVYQLLEVYDWLQKSFYALNFDEKLLLKEQTLVFPGFCPKTEKPLVAYATFLLENFDRFAYLEVMRPLHTQKPMRPVYEEMLRGLPNFGADVMTSAQLKAIIAYISAIKSAPQPETHEDLPMQEAC